MYKERARQSSTLSSSSHNISPTLSSTFPSNLFHSSIFFPNSTVSLPPPNFPFSLTNIHTKKSLANMRTTVSAGLVFASTLLSTTTSALSLPGSYTLTIHSSNPRLNTSTVVPNDESTAPTYPNPLGSFSTGEPRHAYTFTLTSVAENDARYELKSTAKHTQLVLNGNPIAPQFFEVPVGAAPAPIQNQTVTRDKFLVAEGFGATLGRLLLQSAEEVKGSDGNFAGAGSWRACNGSTVDYQLYWFDGLNDLNDVLSDCEAIALILTEVETDASSTHTTRISSASSTDVPASTKTTSECATSNFITGVPAPSTLIINDGTLAPARSTLLSSNFLTGVPAPSTDALLPGVPAPTTTTTTTTLLTHTRPTPTTFQTHTRPTPSSSPTITLRLTNDQTGASSHVSIPLNATPLPLTSLLPTTGTSLFATSAQLISFTDATVCRLVNERVPGWIVELDGRARNFVDLDGVKGEAVPVEVGGFVVQCLEVEV
ncbi:hypothetical protein BDW02DRAFT_551693 [Decorospora gaudefroyi]|uniref:Uncharacterized protein n=1 Tax=Decorospora gaudefroyi TaxID=184978 RepID=A0A6A5KKA1_9PLEO|nr:hypothetical protein BDW02DRAFT_551693 [Decorospora gaudefroyi]